MAEIQKVRIKVVSQKGTCEVGHKVGDEWVIDGKTPEGLLPFCLRFPASHSHAPNVWRLVPLGKRPGYDHGGLPRFPKPGGL